MKTLKNLKLLGLIAVSLFVGLIIVPTPESYGHEPAPEDIVSKADMIVYGVVSSVEYSKSSEGTPHTFVTYKIHKKVSGKIKGQTSAEAITLRFIGGPVGDGSFLTLLGAPNFRVGDKDVLLIRNNGVSDCPLVQCEGGRFRVHNNGVYGSKGQPVVATKGGKIIRRGRKEPQLKQEARYPAPSFDALIKRKDVQEQMKQMGATEAELRKRFEREAPREIVITEETHLHSSKDNRSEDADRATTEETPGSGAVKAEGRGDAGKSYRPMSVDNFLGFLDSKARERKTPRNEVSSLNSRRSFSAKKVHLAPRQEPFKTEESAGEGAQNKKELEMLKRNNFNPVLK